MGGVLRWKPLLLPLWVAWSMLIHLLGSVFPTVKWDSDPFLKALWGPAKRKLVIGALSVGCTWLHSGALSPSHAPF